MQKITKEQFEAYQAKQRFSKNPIKEELRNLAVGEGLFIPKESWTNKTPPAGYGLIPGAKFSLKTLLDNTGWAMLRVQ